MKVYIKSVADIYASSLNRIRQHVNENNIGILTAYITSDSPDRPSKTSKQSNNKNMMDNKQLSADLQRLGFGFNHVTGYYDEGQSGNPDIEQSYFVICPKSVSYDNFKKSLFALAKKYEQQSVVIWSYETQTATLYGTTDFKSYDVWEKYHTVGFDVDRVQKIAWTEYKNRIVEFYNPEEIQGSSDFILQSCTEMSNAASGPSSLLAAKHFRELLLEEYA